MEVAYPREAPQPFRSPVPIVGWFFLWPSWGAEPSGDRAAGWPTAAGSTSTRPTPPPATARRLILVGAAAFIVVGVVAGTIAAGIGVVEALVTQGPAILLGVLVGVVVSAAVFGGMVAAEPMTLQLRGYRRMSRRERERLLPLLEAAAQRLSIAGLPPVLIADDGTRNAYTHVRHLVISRTLDDELADEPLAAVLAHALHHWVSADSLGLRFVFACALPLALLYDLAVILARFRSVVAIVGWFFLWPSWVLTRLVIQPLVAERSRQQEYEADAAARNAGYGEALREAVTYLGEFEGGRSGWEQVIAATHPPTELRLEALE